MPRRKYPLKLDGLMHDALNPQPMPTRSVSDYDALVQRMVGNDDWTVLRVDPTQDRRTTVGAWESPVVKAFNCYVRQALKRHLYTQRLVRDSWYLQLGPALKEKTNDE